MAKGIGINGEFRGKIGGIVYSRVNGEQLSRAKASYVSNPKTNKQQAQRAIFATATQAYSALQEITNHSFEGVKYGSKSQQYFMKEALKLLRSRAAAGEGQFLIPGVSTIMANPFLISKGSVASVKNVSWDGDAGEKNFSIINMTNPTVDGSTVITVASFCTALGINKGDQITFVAITDDGGDDIGAYENLNYRQNHVRIARITVKADAADDALVLSDNDEFGDSIITENIGFTAAEQFQVLSLSTNSLVLGLTNAVSLLALAVIRSVKDGDTWKRSTERLQCATDGIMLYEFNDVLPAWLAGTTPITLDSDRYLNNAEQESVSASYSVASVPVTAVNNTTSRLSVQPVACVERTLGSEVTKTPIADENDFAYTLNDAGHLVLSTTYKIPVVNKYTLEQAKRLVPSIVVDNA